jgi:sugar/nucleoside kinase (ribokinase family)
MSFLVVGSVALDTVRTPFGEAVDVVGGSALYCAASASYFTKVRVVGVVGEDFPLNEIDFLKTRGVDFQGLHVACGDTFRWAGVYGHDFNTRETLETRLNVFAEFNPQLPDVYRDSRDLFLANIDPALQLNVLEQVKRPRLVACDTMNFWIERKRDLLNALLKQIDVLILNDAEVREMAGSADLIKAAKQILDMGPRIVIVKKGEHGAFMVSKESFFALPAFPTEGVRDPTGAGDCFAGGFMGYLAQTEVLNDDAFRRAIVYGSVLASFNIEAFSIRRFRSLTKDEIDGRVRALREVTRF